MSLFLPSHEQDGVSWNCFVVSDFHSLGPKFVFVSLRVFSHSLTFSGCSIDMLQ